MPLAHIFNSTMTTGTNYVACDGFTGSNCITTSAIIRDSWNGYYANSAYVAANQATNRPANNQQQAGQLSQSQQSLETPEERRAARKSAEARAEALLLATLDRDQQDDFRRARLFYVHTKTTKPGVAGRCYRVEYGAQGNIKLLNDKGHPVARFCVHPDLSIPVPDIMLAQKLLLESDENEFLRIANRTPLVSAA